MNWLLLEKGKNSRVSDRVWKRQNGRMKWLKQVRTLSLKCFQTFLLLQWWLAISRWRGLRRDYSILELFMSLPSPVIGKMCALIRNLGVVRAGWPLKKRFPSYKGTNWGISLPCQQRRSWCLTKLMILFFSHVRDLEDLVFSYMDWNKTLSLWGGTEMSEDQGPVQPGMGLSVKLKLKCTHGLDFV